MCRFYLSVLFFHPILACLQQFLGILYVACWHSWQGCFNCVEFRVWWVSHYVGIMLVLLNVYYTLGSRHKGYTLIKVKFSTVTESGINVPFTRIKTNAKLTVKVFLNGPINLEHFFFGEIGPSRLRHSYVMRVSSLVFIDGI